MYAFCSLANGGTAVVMRLVSEGPAPATRREKESKKTPRDARGGHHDDEEWRRAASTTRSKRTLGPR
eukprot:scaffold15998_cov111-Isochrysis_galbana.AAC.1